MSEAGLTRLQNCLQQVQSGIYPEPPSRTHNEITLRAIDRFLSRHRLGGTSVLDVGCGQGVALAEFVKRGLSPVGVTLGEDYEVCRNKGYEVRDMDLSFLDFEDASFDLVWCRHAIEHSIFPYFTLIEMRRLLRPGGFIYVEVPAPDTPCQHESNQNHFSVLGKRMWEALFRRANLNVLESMEIRFKVPAGPDLYWSFDLGVHQ
jgi:SAM-dependent methyltransferase